MALLFLKRCDHADEIQHVKYIYTGKNYKQTLMYTGQKI